jgi:hypothetical protein
MRTNEKRKKGNPKMRRSCSGTVVEEEVIIVLPIECFIISSLIFLKSFIVSSINPDLSRMGCDTREYTLKKLMSSAVRIRMGLLLKKLMSSVWICEVKHTGTQGTHDSVKYTKLSSS